VFNDEAHHIHDNAPGVAAFAKNYLAVGFKLDYVKTDGDLSNYTPDFIVKGDDGSITIVETKGRENSTCRAR
jgi:type III restriction enzyme